MKKSSDSLNLSVNIRNVCKSLFKLYKLKGQLFTLLCLRQTDSHLGEVWSARETVSVGAVKLVQICVMQKETQA